ncbi:MAG: DUF2079 domain-containing protein, partial [Acidobacteriota bacterium]|nr:DUF2079 domain-containing protein [Acidobacteriota bacterium]
MLELASVVFGGLFPLLVACALGMIAFRQTPMPFVVRFGIGAAIESLMVFLLLLAGWARWPVFLGGGLIALGLLYWIRPKAHDHTPAITPLDRASFYILLAVFATYSALYLVHALAPEIQPDAITYHLGLVSEYVRLGRFPHRIGFYEMVPQGLEMLFSVAFAFGGHSAAKLVHFAFLAATVPLVLSIGRQLNLSDRVSLVAAALYLCAPVVGVSGTCAYNDAAFVFFVLAAFYFLLARQWAPAGIAAGFCFAIKVNGLLIAPIAVLAAWLIGRRIRAPLLVAAAALTMIAPWMVRDAVLTGNPVAPLFNRVFPNPYFRVDMERHLAATLGSYSGFQWTSAPMEYIVGGNLQGTIGPAFFLLPIGLLALRNRAGRLIWAAAAVALAPWLWNVGARFLMPALPFLALAIAMTLPKPLAWACLIVQAVACLPALTARYESSSAWKLEGWPWRAALRLEPEHVYLDRQVPAYKLARVVEKNTRTGDRIFDLAGIANAYTTREVVSYWHSAQANQLTDALAATLTAIRFPQVAMSFRWQATTLRRLRFRTASPGPNEWRLFDVNLFSDGSRVFICPQWSIKAFPNSWETLLALDENRATFWSSW